MSLHLSEGDEIAYEIDGCRVIPTKRADSGTDHPFGVFTEWDSAADRKVYAKL